MASWVGHAEGVACHRHQEQGQVPLLVYLKLARLAEEAVVFQGRPQSLDSRLHRLRVDVAVDDDLRRGGFTGRELFVQDQEALRRAGVDVEERDQRGNEEAARHYQAHDGLSHYSMRYRVPEVDPWEPGEGKEPDDEHDDSEKDNYRQELDVC